MIIITSDHAGYDLKEKLKIYFKKEGIDFVDNGPNTKNPTDDYPDYVVSASKLVLKNKTNKGVFICGTGFGMNIAANKIKGIRAVNLESKGRAKLAVEHNNINVVTLGALSSSLGQAKKIIKIIMSSTFIKGKHLRRVKKIKELEKLN